MQKLVWQEKEQVFEGKCRYAMDARGLGRGYKTTGLGRDVNILVCGGNVRRFYCQLRWYTQLLLCFS